MLYRTPEEFSAGRHLCNKGHQPVKGDSYSALKVRKAGREQPDTVRKADHTIIVKQSTAHHVQYINVSSHGDFSEQRM